MEKYHYSTNIGWLELNGVNGKLAERIGRPGSARAVGQVQGANSFPLFIPCHRVIRSDDHLGGCSGGKHWKANLLRHEGHRIESDRCMGSIR